MHLSHIASANRVTVALVLASSLLKPVLAAPQLVSTGHGLEGGSITALAIDPQTPDTLYAGTKLGGVFKSVDGGNNWHPMNAGGLTDVCTRSTTPYSTDKFCFYVTALAIDPLTPTTLYAGTWSRGLFKSTNGGATWSAISVVFPLFIHSLVIDPRTPTTLYVGGCSKSPSSDGVFKSTDGGASWYLLKAGLTGNPCFVALAIDPQTPSTLYAGTNQGGVLKTTDGGANWRPVNSGLSNTYVTCLVIDPQTPTNIYVGVAGIAGQTGGVAKSINGGESWSEVVNTGLTFSENSREATEVQVLAIDPLTPTTLFAAVGAERFPRELPGGLFKSTDGGKSWRSLGGDFNLSPGVYALVVDYRRPITLYAGVAVGGVLKSADGGTTWRVANGGLTGLDLNVRALAIDPRTPTTVYAGTTGGVFRSTDRGGSWHPVNTGLGWVEILALAVDPQMPSTIYAGTSGSGVFKSTDGGGGWRSISAGLARLQVATLAIDPRTPTTVYLSTPCRYSGAKGRMVTPGEVFRSTNAGGKWVALDTALHGTPLTPGLDTVFVSNLAIDSRTPTTIYASVLSCTHRHLSDAQGTREAFWSHDPLGVIKSTDGGTTWSRVSQGWSPAGTLAVDPKSPDTIYAGVDGGGVSKSIDAARSWRPIHTGLTNLHVHAVAIDPQTPTSIYVGTDGGVYKSTDGGDSWRPINADLSDPAVIALAIDPKTPTILYAATASGVFVIWQ
jgi:photosystem II stability/assembly factor-like uncharacterized protein